MSKSVWSPVIASSSALCRSQSGVLFVCLLCSIQYLNMSCHIIKTFIKLVQDGNLCKSMLRVY